MLPTSPPARRPYRAQRLADTVMQWVFALVALSTVLLLVGIFVFLLQGGARMFLSVGAMEFFFGATWNPTALSDVTWGILSLALSTVMVAAGALAFAVPFGLALAIYLAYLAPRRTREVLKPVIEMIAGIPSVVLGLVGLLFVAPAVAWVFQLSNGLNALTASVLVGLTVVPTIASLCEDALSSVPARLMEASLALGATPWEAIRRVMLPAASSGVLAAIMLGLGRAIGETMVVLMVAGNSLAMPESYLDPVRPMTATIAIEIREVVVGGLHWQALFAVGLTLFVVTFVLNTVADVILHRQQGT
jgi:phosphate transport system permease protein